MIDGIKNRLATITRAAGELAALLERPLPPLHESRLAARLATIDAGLTELLAHTRQLLAAAEENGTFGSRTARSSSPLSKERD
jgi:hypothetical protein